ncbi:mechanosensitive ion channel family protein [Agathobaculum desmolans]|uniref:mechanosensitive ion channel family protein n=1 Tax=Agathobaculum desmolans TaxID=39484 RepID=UPI00068A0218|nr:mechanosensitive ion channel family protein [Agathobaculum desmolans]
MTAWMENFVQNRLPELALGALFVAASVAVTLIASRLVNRLMCRLIERQKKVNSGSATILAFFRYVAVAAVYFAGFAVIVSNIPALSAGVNKVLAAGGILAVIGGLAAQEALGSVVSGLVILAFKPFVIGDVVRCVDTNISGVIEEITLRHTAIRTYENKRVIVPNSVMNSAIVENADYADSRVCVFLEVGVTYESNVQLAKQLLAETVAAQPDYLDVRTPDQKAEGVPEVQVVVLALADSAVTLRASLWARDNATAFSLKCAVQEEILQVYERAGVEIAYPHVTVLQK